MRALKTCWCYATPCSLESDGQGVLDIELEISSVGGWRSARHRAKSNRSSATWTRELVVYVMGSKLGTSLWSLKGLLRHKELLRVHHQRWGRRDISPWSSERADVLTMRDLGQRYIVQKGYRVWWVFTWCGYLTRTDTTEDTTEVLYCWIEISHHQREDALGRTIQPQSLHRKIYNAIALRSPHSR